MSGTPGGDNGAVRLDILSGGIVDMAGNQQQNTMNLAVTEIADTTLPYVTGAKLNYSTGELIITASETIDVSSPALVDLAKIFIADISSTRSNCIPSTVA